MRAIRLYTEQSLQEGCDVQLQYEQAHYLAHVLRMRAGDHVKLFNDEDFEYDAKLETLSRKEAVLQVLQRHERFCESPLNICIGIAVSRGQHMDFSVQKAVELGVRSIVPILSEFSNVRIRQGRIQNKMTRWRNIIRSATEQCGRTRLTVLEPPDSFYSFIYRKDKRIKMLLHPESKMEFTNIEGKPDNISLLIGPEGGFSDNEVEQALSMGYLPLHCGPRMLRAETAVVATLTICQHLWGDFSKGYL